MDYAVTTISIGVFVAFLVSSLIAYIFLVFVVVGCFSQRVSNIISFCIFAGVLGLTTFMTVVHGFWWSSGLLGVLQIYFFLLGLGTLPIVLLLSTRRLSKKERTRKDTLKDILLVVSLVGFSVLIIGLLVHFDPLNALR